MCSVLRNMIKAAKGCQGYKRDVDEDSAITAEKLAGEFIMEMRKLR